MNINPSCVLVVSGKVSTMAPSQLVPRRGLALRWGHWSLWGKREGHCSQLHSCPFDLQSHWSWTTTCCGLNQMGRSRARRHVWGTGCTSGEPSALQWGSSAISMKMSTPKCWNFIWIKLILLSKTIFDYIALISKIEKIFARAAIVNGQDASQIEEHLRRKAKALIFYTESRVFKRSNPKSSVRSVPKHKSKSKLEDPSWLTWKSNWHFCRRSLLLIKNI